MMLRIGRLARLFGPLLLGLCAAGCGKKSEASIPVTASPVQAPASSESAPTDSAVAESPSAPAPSVSDPSQLNRALRRWILRNQRPPTNFQDFAATAGIQIAPPPEGKKYAIDKTMHVILVKR